MKNKSKEIIDKFKPVSHGCRVVMLINRGIKNTNKGSKRWISKLVSTNEDALQKNIETLLFQQQYLNDENIRLYMCLNPRNLDRSVKYFQHKQIDLSSKEEIEYFYTRINDKFCSSLMQPENKIGSLFLIDWDIEKEPQLNQFPGKEVIRYKTQNGWHVITEPFTPSIVSHNQCFEIKKDALVLLNTL